MLPKNLDQCIQLAMCTGPLSSMRENLRNELRKFFAHQILIEAGKYDPNKSDADKVLMSFFNKIFKDIPHTKS